MAWHDLIQHRGGDEVSAKQEWDELFRVGLWEEHAGKLYVLLNATYAPSLGDKDNTHSKVCHTTCEIE